MNTSYFWCASSKSFKKLDFSISSVRKYKHNEMLSSLFGKQGDNSFKIFSTIFYKINETFNVMGNLYKIQYLGKNFQNLELFKCLY